MRDQSLTVWLTKEEMAKVRADAEAKGLNMADLVRKRLGLQPAPKGRPKGKPK